IVGTLLGPEPGRGLHEPHVDVAGAHQLHAPQSARLLDGRERPHSTVGRRRATEAHHHRAAPHRRASATALAAATTSWPVPRVEATKASLPSAPPTSANHEAWAISTTAT